MIQDIFPHQFYNAYEADAQPDADSIVQIGRAHV